MLLFKTVMIAIAVTVLFLTTDMTAPGRRGTGQMGGVKQDYTWWMSWRLC